MGVNQITEKSIVKINCKTHLEWSLVWKALYSLKNKKKKYI